MNDVDSGYAKYAQSFAAIAEKEKINVILYITAPHAQNAQPVDAPLGLKQTKMELETVLKLSKKIKPFAVVPVALGINNIQKNGIDLHFRYKSDMHPNQYSAFLTANMFYAAFFKASTEGFSFNTVVETKLKNGKGPDGTNKTVIFNNVDKLLLQKSAYNAVMEFNNNLKD